MEQLCSLGATRYQLSKPEIKKLPHILFDNESVKAFVLGFYDGGYAMLVATELRLLFVDVMPLGRTIVDDIPYNMLGSTGLGMGIVFASVTIFARAKTYRFWWVKKQDAQKFNDYVEIQMLRHQRERLEGQ